MFLYLAFSAARGGRPARIRSHIRALSAEALYGGEGVLVQGIRAGLDIDGNDLAVIPRLHPSAHLSFVDLIAAPAVSSTE